MGVGDEAKLAAVQRHFIFSMLGKEHLIGCNQLMLERSRYGDYFKDGARFKHVGDRPRLQCLCIRMSDIVRVHARDMRHRKHFAGIRVEDHCKSGSGLHPLHALL